MANKINFNQNQINYMQATALVEVTAEAHSVEMDRFNGDSITGRLAYAKARTAFEFGGDAEATRTRQEREEAILLRSDAAWNLADAAVASWGDIFTAKQAEQLEGLGELVTARRLSTVKLYELCELLMRSEW